jgi:hypothetical protein
MQSLNLLHTCIPCALITQIPEAARYIGEDGIGVPRVSFATHGKANCWLLDVTPPCRKCGLQVGLFESSCYLISYMNSMLSSFK